MPAKNIHRTMGEMAIDPEQKENHVKIAQMEMPFGKYKGRVLIDLQEPYLLWFANKGFPEGKLGQLLALCLEIKVKWAGVAYSSYHKHVNTQF